MALCRTRATLSSSVASRLGLEAPGDGCQFDPMGPLFRRSNCPIALLPHRDLERAAVSGHVPCRLAGSRRQRSLVPSRAPGPGCGRRACWRRAGPQAGAVSHGGRTAVQRLDGAVVSERMGVPNCESTIRLKSQLQRIDMVQHLVGQFAIANIVMPVVAFAVNWTSLVRRQIHPPRHIPRHSEPPSTNESGAVRGSSSPTDSLEPV